MCIASINGCKSPTTPLLFTCAKIAPKIGLSMPDKLSAVASTSTIEILSGFALVAITALICGCNPLSTTNTASSPPCQTRRARVIDSAAAVASSSIDAFETSSPVKSVTTV